MLKGLGSKAPYTAAAAAAVIFGFSFLFTKSALSSLSIFQLLGFRFAMAALFLTTLWVTGVIKINIKLENIKGLLVIAIFQPVLYFVLETIGVNLTSASESGIIIALVPISITLFAVILLKEHLSIFQWISIIVSVLGVILIARSGSGGNESSHLIGVIALVGAVIAAGMYNILSKKISRSHSPLEITFIMMWVGAIVFNITGIANYMGDIKAYASGLLNPAVIIDVLYLGVLSSVGAFFLLNYSLSKIEASKSAVFMNLTPIITVLAGIAIRGEKFYFIQCFGAILILIGIWGANYSKSPKR